MSEGKTSSNPEIQTQVDAYRDKITGNSPGISQETANQMARSLTARDVRINRLRTDVRQKDALAEDAAQRANEAEMTSTTDALTGLPNLRAFRTEFKRRVGEMRRTEFVSPGETNPDEQAQENNPKMFLVVLDLDRFKELNEYFGHMGANDALKVMAELNTRPGEPIFRWGGDEFVLLIGKDSNGNNPTEEEAVNLIKRLRREYKKLAHQKFASKITQSKYEGRMVNRHPTLTFGIAEYREGDTEDTLFTRADGPIVTKDSFGRDSIFVTRKNMLTGGNYTRRIELETDRKK